jgi:hypothetical protein
MANGVKITGTGKKQPGPDDEYSLAFDFREMLETENYYDIDYTQMSVEITKPDGTYITTLRTDKFGITNRFFTKKQEKVVAWACKRSGSWEVIEEYEVDDDDPEVNDV